jgi:hypothetical protein
MSIDLFSSSSLPNHSHPFLSFHFSDSSIPNVLLSPIIIDLESIPIQ